LKSQKAQNVGVWAGLHGPPYVKGNLVFCGWGTNGMIILDIADINQPQLVGQLKHNHPLPVDFAGRGVTPSSRFQSGPMP
jgi:hypothetical protein